MLFIVKYADLFAFVNNVFKIIVLLSASFPC